MIVTINNYKFETDYIVKAYPCDVFGNYQEQSKFTLIEEKGGFKGIYLCDATELLEKMQKEGEDMDKFCEDCIHNEVCQYGAIPPHIGRCNDKDTLDDIRPQGEWLHREECTNNRTFYITECPFCKLRVQEETNFCPNCGADMRKGGTDNDK